MEKTDKLKQSGGMIFAAVFTYMVLSSFLSQQIYSATTRYASLIFSVSLVLLLLPYIKDALKTRDRGLAAVILTAAVSMFNLFLIHSNKGAVLIPTDLALMFFTAERVSFSERLRKYTAFAGSALLIYWFGAVKWSYNFNMAGLTFLIMLIMGMIFLEFMKWERELEYLKYVQVLLYVTAFLYATLYHSRCAMAGILVFGLFLLAGRKTAGNRIAFSLSVCALSLGSIIFTLIYVIIGHTGFNARFLYKDLLSGRQDIWAELWGAFLKQPLTGIGSSYKLKSFDIFEVHNGMFDILAVHGVIVFALIIYLMMRYFNAARDNAYRAGGPALIAMAGIFAMMAASFFENFFTVPPYSLFFFYLLVLCRGNEP